MRFGLPAGLDASEDVSAVAYLRQLALTIAEKFDRLENGWIDLNESISDGYCDGFAVKTNTSVDLGGSVDHQRAVQAAIDALKGQFETQLRIQQKQVQHLIEQERKQKEEEARRLALEQKRKQEEEQKRKEELERQQKEQERAREAEKKAKEAEKQRLEEEEKKQKALEEEKKRQEARLGKGAYKSTAIADEYWKHKNAIADIKKNIVEQLAQDTNLKKATSALKRKINPKLGQLSNSRSHVTNLTSQVIESVNSARQLGQLSFQWILNFLAKAVVDQAETEVTVKQAAALPLAMFVELIMQNFPDFEHFLMARFVKKCPFIIGFVDKIDTEEGRKRMGWRRSEGKWEDESKYDERVAGICTVWSVIAATPSVRAESFSYARLWQFLSRMVNCDQEYLTNAHFACVSNWWEASSNIFLQTYMDQANKLLRLAAVDWTELVASRKYPSAARLRILGDEWLETGKLDYIKPMEY